MAEYIHVQDVFSKGELSPTLYARVTTATYYKGLRQAKNVLPIPQGGARKRFGTLYRATLDQTDYQQVHAAVFEYLSQCVYLVLFYDDSLDIYLEGRLVATVTGTGIDGPDTQLIDHTVLETRLRVTTGFLQPHDLSRSASAANTITGYDANDDTLTVTNALTLDIILPAQWTTTGTLPDTNPPIKVERTYFVRALTTTTVAVYATAEDARDDTNRFTINDAGTGTNDLLVLNTWAFNAVTFRNYPTHDFTGGYDALTFTPAATTGTTTLTASGAIFTAAHVGGLFIKGFQVARITGFTSTTEVDIEVIEDFDSTSALSGSLCTLTEPAWSDARGWPRVCSNYQNRAFFANTESIPNGLWGSAINDFDDFDDSQTLDDDAISWYPTSDVANDIKFITPFRSLLIHTSSGVYSTPLTYENAITPNNFALTLQDNTPTADIQPVVIDNQVIILSGRDVHSLIYDSTQSGYTPAIVSALSEHLITQGIDMAGFRDRQTAGGRYVFLANEDGTLAMYQTLYSEEVAGWTPANFEQPYGQAWVRKVLTTNAGRCWFIVEREIAEEQSAINITDFDDEDDTLTAVGSNFATDTPTAVLFTGTTLPATEPALQTDRYYFVLGLTADTFQVYGSYQDAEDAVNALFIDDAGTSAQVVPFPLTSRLVLEELSYTVKTDCTVVHTGTDLTTVDDLTLFNAQQVVVKADGKRFDNNPVLNNEVAITIMGQEAEVSEAQVGLAIDLAIEPMPLSVALGQSIQTSNLAQAKHIRYVNALFHNTVGGKINQQNLALKKLSQLSFGAPQGKTGFMQVSNMSGWDDFNTVPFRITHSDPYDFTLLGLFYKLEV